MLGRPHGAPAGAYLAAHAADRNLAGVGCTDAWKRLIELLVLMLAPMTPHICEELWEMLGHVDGLGRISWPQFREDLAKEEQFEVVIQINGRVRGKIQVEDGLNEEETKERALADPRIAQLMNGQTIAKVIVVPRKLVNIVLR